MSCPTVIRVTTAQGPPGIGLPAGGADAGKFVRKAGSTPYAYELVTPDAIGLPQDLAPTSSPTFAGLTLSGLAANGLLFTGTGGALTRLPLGAGLAIVGGALTATGGGGSGSVTSVGLSAPTGFSITGSPVTGSGTLGLVFATGYSLPTDARQAQWDGAVTLAGTAVQPGALAAGLAGKAGTGAIGSSGLTMATLRLLGRTSAGDGPVELLSVVGATLADQVLTITGATDLSYDPATRTVASSTGADAVLSLADGINAGLMSSADYLKLLSLTFGVLPVPVYNNTGATIAKGVPVYVTGSSGTRITIAPADASVEATAARTLGLTSAAIASNAEGTVIAVGELTGLNTSTLAEGEIIWLSETTGAMTTTRPTQPAHGVVLGYCIKQGAGSSGIIYVKVDNGFELDELHDVLIAGKATGQALMVAADGLWKNRLLTAADLSDSTATGRSVLTGTPAQGRTALELGSAALAASTDFATAAQGTLATTAIQPAALAGYVQTSDARLTDAREWSAATIEQAEAEGGTATTRRAFTAQRVRQAIAAWWGGYASSVGQALATAIDATAGRTAIGAEQAGAAAAAQAFALQRGNHTGTQSASTITGLAAVATSGAYADLSGRFDPASPGAIGGTTPAAGTFTAGVFTQSILLPDTAPGTPAAGHLYRVANTLRYRDSGAAERLLLNATDNLANLADPAAALANIGGMPRTIQFTDLAYAATINIDFAAYDGRFVSIGTLTGNLSITFSNIVRGRQVTVTIASDSSLRTITYPGATPFGGIKQTTLSPSKRMFVSFTVYGSGGGDVDVWATALPQL
jgi:hypothetical protein